MPNDRKIKKEEPKKELAISRRAVNVIGIVIAVFVILALAGIAGVVAWTLLHPILNPLIYPATLVPRIELSQLSVSDIVKLLTVPNLIVKSPFVTASDSGNQIYTQPGA